MKAVLLFLTVIISFNLSLSANSKNFDTQLAVEPPPVKGQGICPDFPACEKTETEQEPPTKVA